MNPTLCLKRIIPLLVFSLILANLKAYAQQSDATTQIYYFYEIGNQIPLADFELGSKELIKDRDGNGLGFSQLIKKGNQVRLSLDLGYSRTVYKGAVEDAVEVAFVPQAGTGYDILSSSTNVTYDFDLEFQNPYLGLKINIGAFSLAGGRIFQSVKGDVTLSSSNIEIATAEYETRNQLYAQMGLDFHLDEFYFGMHARAFESPELKITSCNEAALGTLACTRIRSAAGNRNLRSNAFGEGLIYLGMRF